jgi:hypothetical protein
VEEVGVKETENSDAVPWDPNSNITGGTAWAAGGCSMDEMGYESPAGNRDELPLDEGLAEGFLDPLDIGTVPTCELPNWLLGPAIPPSSLEGAGLSMAPIWVSDIATESLPRYLDTGWSKRCRVGSIKGGT